MSIEISVWLRRGGAEERALAHGQIFPQICGVQFPNTLSSTPNLIPVVAVFNFDSVLGINSSLFCPNPENHSPSVPPKTLGSL